MTPQQHQESGDAQQQRSEFGGRDLAFPGKAYKRGHDHGNRYCSHYAISVKPDRLRTTPTMSGAASPFITHPSSFIISPSSPIASCNFLIARIQSICTAGRERPMRSATSLNGSRCRFRSTMTS